VNAPGSYAETADIEMTLAFGVHGPRDLIVMIIEDR
jgi:L-lactate utilization protein LutC